MTNRQLRDAHCDAISIMYAMYAIAACFLVASAMSPFMSVMIVIMWATAGTLALAGVGYGVRAWFLGRRIARNA